jgi:hypothetical protein
MKGLGEREGEEGGREGGRGRERERDILKNKEVSLWLLES